MIYICLTGPHPSCRHGAMEPPPEASSGQVPEAGSGQALQGRGRNSIFLSYLP